MASPVIDLAISLISDLQTQTGLTFTRRIAPYLKREDITGGKWIVIVAGDEQETAGRHIDRSTLTVDVAYQEPLPEKTDAQPNPLENLSWFDVTMAKVEDVKNLFRGNGPLRDAAYDGLVFFRMINTPIYRPDLHVDYQIFTSVVRLEFVGEIASS